jgi:hypothetical protein
MSSLFGVRLWPTGIDASLLEHLDDHSQGGALAIAIVLTQQVPGKVLLQDRPDEIVPKTSVETLVSCQAVDTVKTSAPLRGREGDRSLRSTIPGVASYPKSLGSYLVG